jgi:hypothetical protein
MFFELGSFVITKQQKECYKTGDLWRDWLRTYPNLFDEKDQQLFRNQAIYGYGFVEFLSIIFLYNATGYIPIFGNYGWETQPYKNTLIKEFVSKETWEVIMSQKKYHSQPPDLFVYAPDKTDYFFCEVKGPGDRLRETQIQYFQLLQEISGKPVYTIKFRLAPFKK